MPVFRILLLNFICVSVICCLTKDEVFLWENLNLPRSHIPYFFTNNPDIRKQCEIDDNCPFQDLTQENKYWGYESPECDNDLPEYDEEKCLKPTCTDHPRLWAQTRAEQVKHFWTEADFGIVLSRKKELQTLCKSNSQDDSSLKCVSYIRYCEGKNIYVDLGSANIEKGSIRYREDLLAPGQIGGHCSLDAKRLKSEGGHKSPLQSWFAEIEHFTSLDFYPSKGENCDIVFDKPTYLIKLDAAINMYHHFCDFVNLYVSQHVNNSFNTDVNIIIWDTASTKHWDLFNLTWKAFTDHHVIFLKELNGKKICLKNAVFSFLARQRLGLYYNMPVMPGCAGSSLFQAFNEHIIHRLAITQEGPLRDKIRITLLARNTMYRNILNQDELASALKTIGEFEVNVVVYSRQMSFEEQLQRTYNSDIFIGMHGAGLTHMLFQPDWGVVFELYNCEDKDCYSDLARLRGIKYMTWENKDKLVQEDEGHHPTLGAHAKFTNYAFDVKEFMRLIFIAADHVQSHKKFLKAWQVKYGKEEQIKTQRTEL